MYCYDGNEGKSCSSLRIFLEGGMAKGHCCHPRQSRSRLVAIWDYSNRITFTPGDGCPEMNEHPEGMSSEVLIQQKSLLHSDFPRCFSLNVV
jgi:hypothetical protein